MGAFSDASWNLLLLAWPNGLKIYTTETGFSRQKPQIPDRVSQKEVKALFVGTLSVGQQMQVAFLYRKEHRETNGGIFQLDLPVFASVLKMALIIENHCEITLSTQQICLIWAKTPLFTDQVQIISNFSVFLSDNTSVRFNSERIPHQKQRSLWPWPSNNVISKEL